MTKMMKQMGVDMDELDAKKVEVDLEDKKLVFKKPELSKIDAQGNEIFQLRGSYSTEEKSSVEDEDIELVVERADVSREEAKEALEDADDPADAIVQLQS